MRGVCLSKGVSDHQFFNRKLCDLAKIFGGSGVLWTVRWYYGIAGNTVIGTALPAGTTTENNL